MRIWVDADACPNAIKEVLFRAAERLQIRTILVANQYVRTPPSRVVESVQVAAGFDVADHTIVERMASGDLVITGDVPLAAEVVAKGGAALNPRGKMYTRENVRDYLQRRDMMDELRSVGAVSGGPSALGKKEVQHFANALDQYLAKHHAQPRS